MLTFNKSNPFGQLHCQHFSYFCEKNYKMFVLNNASSQRSCWCHSRIKARTFPKALPGGIEQTPGCYLSAVLRSHSPNSCGRIPLANGVIIISLQRIWQMVLVFATLFYLCLYVPEKKERPLLISSWALAFTSKAKAKAIELFGCARAGLCKTLEILFVFSI
jgi:hypothetical protein